MTDLARVEKLIEKATPGPWEVSEEALGLYICEAGLATVTSRGADERRISPESDLAFIAHARQLLPLAMELAKSLKEFGGRLDHDWRCEYRTAEAGWHEGDPPVVICECGYDELDRKAKALDAYIAENLEVK